MGNLRLVIADDHSLFRMGLVSLLKKEGYMIVGQASDGKEAIQVCREKEAEVVLMDIDLPEMNGIEATKIILEENPGIHVLALTWADQESTIIKMIQAGARGYVIKDAEMDELNMAIHAIAKGNTYFSHEAASFLIAHLNKRQGIQRAVQKGGKDWSITPREMEILQYIAEEFSNKEIAAKLFISPRTVETHRRNLIQKLHVKNTVGLIKFYLKHHFNFQQSLQIGK